MKRIGRRSVILGLTAAAAAPATIRPVWAQKTTPVATQLGWLRNGEFAAIMVAEAKGFFEEAGIAHKIVDGGPGKNPIPIVAVGQAEFGLATTGSHLISARTARDPVDIVAIGATFQKAPGAYIRLANPGDPNPTVKDLEGKTVGVQAGSEYLVSTIAKKNGLDESKIKVVTVQANAEPLMVGRIDYFSGWVTNQTYQIEQESAKADAPPTVKGKVWKALPLADWGLPAYADVIFATAKLTQEKPELVQAYLKAVSRGIAFILEKPEEALKLVAAFPNQIEPADKLAWRWKIQNPLFSSPATAKNGPLWMEASVWDANAEVLKEAGQVPRMVPAAEMMTNKFLPGAKAG